jgi:hypothetical protein
MKLGWLVNAHELIFRKSFERKSPVCFAQTDTRKRRVDGGTARVVRCCDIFMGSTSFAVKED